MTRYTGVVAVKLVYLVSVTICMLCRLKRAKMDYADVAEETFNLAHPKLARHSNKAR